MLFSIVKESRCTDTLCFQEKAARHFNNIEASWKADNPDHYLLRISPFYSSDPNVLGGGFMALKSREKCSDNAFGLWVEGARRGEITRICRSSSGCKLHWSRGRSEHEKSAAKKERLEIQKAEYVLRSVGNKIASSGLELTQYRELAKLLCSRLGSDSRRGVAKALGLTPAIVERYGSKYKDYEIPLTGHIDTATESEIHSVLCQLALYQSTRWGKLKEDGDLVRFATLLSLDVPTLAEDCEREIEEKKTLGRKGHDVAAANGIDKRQSKTSTSKKTSKKTSAKPSRKKAK